METRNNDMDKKLRQLENQSLPDLSRQDVHWQQMQQLLTTGDATPIAKQPRNGWPWFIAAAIITVVVVIGYQLLAPVSPEKSHTTAFPLPGTKTEETTSSSPVTTIPDTQPAGKESSAYTTKTTKQNRILVSAPKVTYYGRPVSGDTAIPVPDVTNQPVASKKESITLAGFFNNLEKKAQEIIIDPGIDNLVKGTAGTALLIPAHTFNSESNVTIMLKEYYSYEDIITNKLSTTSNGEPLITGGMLHIQAFADGKEISLNPGKHIRWFVPDTTSNMAGMELFTGHKHATAALDLAYRKPNNGGDTARISDRREIINWVSEKQPFVSTYIQTSVKVLDLKDNPYRTRETKNGIVGKFHISNNPKIGRKELAQELKEKYGYNKVKIRNRTTDRNQYSNKASPISGGDYWVSYEDVGDSAWIDSKLAARYKLKATDSISYTVSTMPVMQGGKMKNIFATINLNALANRYSVDISTLGWINCDRFYRNNGPKTDYYVNIADTASNYYTILVFDKMKSMMIGYASGNRVIFPNLPVGVKAKVLCVGIQQGKPVAAVANLADVGNGIDQLKFEETSPASFREQAAMIDK